MVYRFEILTLIKNVFENIKNTNNIIINIKHISAIIVGTNIYETYNIDRHQYTTICQGRPNFFD